MKDKDQRRLTLNDKVDLLMSQAGDMRRSQTVKDRRKLTRSSKLNEQDYSEENAEKTSDENEGSPKLKQIFKVIKCPYVQEVKNL